jgi:hypothetical protein
MLRDMFVLLQDRSLFPVMLSNARLSGCGSDSLFVGVMRPVTQLEASSGTSSIVRFWTTPSGIILYADRNTRDCFGVDANSLVGRPLGSFCTEPDSVNR